MAVKTHIPGTTVSVGYESETADRAIIRCLVTQETDHVEAIQAAVEAVGETLYRGSLNMPLTGTDVSRFGDGKYIVSLQYSRNQRARRRDQTQRRIKIKSNVEYVDAYLVNVGTGAYSNGYINNADPASADWHSIPMRGGNLQNQELVPRPYKLQRPMMTITLDYTTEVLTISDAELAKTGKLNSNVFSIPEIGGTFAANTLRYEAFESGKNDIGSHPWSTTIVLTYDPFGHYRQQAVWDQTLNSTKGKWKTISTYLSAESTTF